MNILRRLQWALMFITLTISISSCLKSEDPEFAIVFGNYYIMQTYQGGAPYYTPYVFFGANEAIASASLTSQSNPLGYALDSLTTSLRQVDLTHPMNTSYSQPDGQYAIRIKNAKNELAVWDFSMNKTKTLGEFKNSTIDYDKADSKVYFSIDTVENANIYGVCISTEDPLENQLAEAQIVSFDKSSGYIKSTGKVEYTFTNNTGTTNLQSNKKYYFIIYAGYVNSNGILEIKTEYYKSFVWGEGS